MVTIRRRLFHWSDMSWSAILAGMLVSLVVQILLTMLGIGAGFISVDVATTSSAFNWAAFLWWAGSGIIAAFAGLAGYANPLQLQAARAPRVTLAEMARMARVRTRPPTISPDTLTAVVAASGRSGPGRRWWCR